VRNTYRIATAAAAALSAVLLLAQAPTESQSKDAKEKTRAETKAKQNARNFEDNARVIAFLDREGKTVGTVGERGLYSVPVLSPDGTRLAVIKNDQAAENWDLWIMDVATGKSIRMTTSGSREWADSPVWSPDGSELVYTAQRNSREAIYRKSASGEGPEELLYRNPGLGLNLTDWSADGRFLSFAKSDLGGGALYVLPLEGQGERQPVEVFHSESQIFNPHFSPDGRFLAYVVSNREARTTSVFVRPVDGGAGPWQVVENSRGNLHWRSDGKELYYLAIDGSVMVSEVSTSPSFTFKEPKVLFRPPGAVPVGIESISRDGKRFVTQPPPRGPQLQQLTEFGRDGKVVNKIGEPGLYGQPAYSPDGKRLAVMKNDLANGQTDIWTFDLATGKGTQLTDDKQFRGGLTWSRDGSHILYFSNRGNYTGVYQRPADGSGEEELLFRYTPGAGLNLDDISPDGKYLICDSGGVMLRVALTGNDPLARTATEIIREEFSFNAGKISPDGKFMAFRSDEADPLRAELYVRPFNVSTGVVGEEKWQLSKNGLQGLFGWQGDGRELFFRDLALDTQDFRMMSVEVSTSPQFEAGTPKLLFTVPGPQGGSTWMVSPDRQRFVFALNVPAE